MGLDPYDARFCTRSARVQAADDWKRASPRIAYIPASIPDLTPQLRQISVPVRVIWGEKDLTLDPRLFPKLVKALPNATGHIIRGRGTSRTLAVHWKPIS